MCDNQFDSQPWYIAPGIKPAGQHCSTVKKWTTNLLNQLYHSSRLYQRLDTSIYEAPPHSLLFGPWIDHHQENEQLNAYELTGEIYAQLAAEAQQVGAKTRLVTVPDRIVLDYATNPTIQAQIIADNPILTEADPHLPYNRFMSLMNHKKISVLDLYPIFLRHI